ncbi:uncharacterized protein LOC144355836 [Saccoglossus kowalevskii]
MTSLWQLQQPTSDIESLRKFYDALEGHIRGLQTLGKPESSYGDLLVPIIRDKLPATIRKQIAREIGGEAWSLPNLRKALLREITAIQSGNPLDESSINNSRYQPDITATFHTNVRSPKRDPKLRNTSAKCTYCKGTHFTSACRVVTDINKRWEIVKRDKLCYNCLGRHRASECKSKFNCRTCKRRHHSTLHQESQPATDVATSDTNPNSPVHVTLTKLNDTHRNSPNNTCLRPVLLKISVGNSQPLQANVLFDEGASRSFISRKFANDLNLSPTRTEQVFLSTFGDNTDHSRALDFASVTAHDLSGHTSNIDVLFISEISTKLTNHITESIHHVDYLRGLTFAHPVTEDKSFSIDLLIGADQYWNYVGDNVIRGNGPTAVSSKFGYLLSGPVDKGQRSTNADVNILHVSTESQQLDSKLQRLWDLESIGVTDDPSAEVCMDFETYRDTHLQIENKKYIARLPWCDNHPPLPTNYDVTVSRTRAMLRRLSPELLDAYNSIIEQQLHRRSLQ